MRKETMIPVKELVCLSALMCAALGGVFAQEQPRPPGNERRRPMPPPGSRHTAAPMQEPALPPPNEDFPPMLEERALVLHVTARMRDSSGGENLISDGSKVTLPGRPVGIKVIGGNIACVVQFTPHIRRTGEVILVAQGQVWSELPGGGIRYETIIKTIPIEFGEQVYFFPLGRETKDDAQLEICLNMKPYSPNPNFERRPVPPRSEPEPDAE